MPRRAPARSAQPASTREAELERRVADLERENDTLRRGQHEAREQQTGTSEVLQAISRGPTDLDRVLATIATSSARLTRCRSVSIRLVEGGEAREGVGLVEVANHGTVMDLPAGSHGTGSMVPPPGFRETVRTGAVTGRAVLERRLIHVPSMIDLPEEEFPDSVAAARSLGNRSMLVAPLLRGEGALGVIVARRWEVVPFTDQEIRLLATFADQAVIAIENARLFTELQDELARRDATAEVLDVISRSPTDPQVVMDTIVAAAMRLCRAENASLLRVGGDGQWYMQAGVGPTPQTLMARRQGQGSALTRDSAAGRAIIDGVTVHIPDAAAVDPGEFPRVRRLSEEFGTRSVLAVPLIGRDAVQGCLSVSGTVAGAFSDQQVKLLETFADQAVIAIENARLFAELQERTEQLTRSVERLTALFEVGQAVGSTLDLDRLLEIVVARASELAGADGGAVYEHDPATGAFDLRATHRMDVAMVAAMREARVGLGDSVVGQAGQRREPVQVADVLAEEHDRPTLRVLRGAGYRAVLAVPLLRETAVVGALVVRRKTPGVFDPDTVALLQTFATQSALAIQNARLFQELADKSRQLEEASRHKSEFLANMSHELRTPLNAVIGFTEVLLERYFGEINAKQEEYLQDVLSSGQHLLALINDILDLSKVEAGRMELELGTFDLGPVLEAGLVMVKERASRAGVALSLDAGEGVGEIEADERKVKQVLFNLLSNAVKFTPDGGAVGVSARRVDGWVEVVVQDTGVGIAPEEQARVFEEFGQARNQAGRSEGTGLGLALCKRFVELHGGTVTVTSEVGVGSTFTVALPVRQPTPPATAPARP